MKWYRYASFAIVIMCCVSVKGAGLQYYWLTPDKVYLWSFAEDGHPVVAMRSPQDGRWDINLPSSSQQWHEVLNAAARNFLPPDTVKTYSDDELWQACLTRLRNETNPPWATQRQTSVEIYLRNKEERTAEVGLIWAEGAAFKNAVFPFQLGPDGVWEKNQDIPIPAIFGVSLKSAQLRMIFDIPNSRPLPDGKAGWRGLWDQWIKGFLTGEPTRPVMYQDERKTWRWMWRERLDPTAPLPTTFRKMVNKSTGPSQTLTPAQSTPRIERGGGGAANLWPLIIWITIVSAMLGLVFLAIFYQRAFRNRLSKLRKILRDPKQFFVKQVNWFSEDGLMALHEATKAEYLGARISSDAAVELLLRANLDWVHQEYLKALNSSAFANKSDEISAGIIEGFKASLGVSEVSASVLKTRLELGNASESTVSQIPSLMTLPGVTTVINSEKLDLKSAEQWLTNWPVVVSCLDVELLRYKTQNDSLAKELSDLRDSHESQLNAHKKQLEENFAAQVKELQDNLSIAREERDRAISELTNAKQVISRLTVDLSKAREDSSHASSDLVNFETNRHAIEEVQKLSKYFRQWVQGFLSQQERTATAERKQLELRPVALLMALANFSLLQLCFSITEGNALLRKGMAHNVLALGQLFGDEPTSANFLMILRGIEGGVDHAANELTDLGIYVVDVQLFRTFLNKLKTDMATDPGTLFVDIDNKDGKIVAVS